MNQPEEKLSAALRELAACSRRSASAEVAVTLKGAFHRHHRRRRQMFRVRIALVCLLVGLTGLFLQRSLTNHTAGQTNVVHTIPPQQVLPPAELSVSTTRQSTPQRHPARNARASVDARGFWALPSFDLVPANDQLRVVRMEMRAEDLRLLGAPVSDVIARHRVTADFVVGHDGTPYAVRLVQANF